jgi:hypothetical protein
VTPVVEVWEVAELVVVVVEELPPLLDVELHHRPRRTLQHCLRFLLRQCPAVVGLRLVLRRAAV